MDALELVNTLALTFTSTEILLGEVGGAVAVSKRAAMQSAWDRYKLPWGGLAVVNVVVGVSRGHYVYEMVDYVVHVPWRGLHALGPEVLFAVLLTSVVGLVLAGVLSKRDKVEVWHRACLVFVVVATFGGSYKMSIWFGHAEYGGNVNNFAKGVIASVAFTGVFYMDARRYCPKLTAGEMIFFITQSILFTLPVIPVAAVLISTMFLVVVVIVESVLRMDPQFINWPIYYCTIYGPFAVVYFQAKKACIQSARRYLPH
mmetsp:Transcript_19517/g.32104  ORF Transcript_19517/g.32104 Transcript_19517/m.32104 type:complete len:258 (+) Transcript_19517:173-946(+)